MIDKIGEILKEKDFKLVEDNLSRFKEADHFSLVYLLRNIIIEKWVHTPFDIPFPLAREMWKTETIDIVEENTKILKELSESAIEEINKAKINDFLWNVKNDFMFAIKAVDAYKKHIESTDIFINNFMAINRLIFISRTINSKGITQDVRKQLIKKVLDEHNSTDYIEVSYLLNTALEEKVDTEYLLQYTEKIISSFDDRSYDYLLIGELCDLLEKFYCEKNGWKKEKCITNPQLIKIRRRKIQSLLMMANSFTSSNPVEILRKVKYLKDAVKILKTINGTELERKELLMEIEGLEKKSISVMPVIKIEHDHTETVRLLRQQLEVLDKEESLCYFLSFIPFPEKKRLEESIKNSEGFASSLFSVGIIGKDGKPIAKSQPIKTANNEFDKEAFQARLEQKAAKTINCFSQIVIGNTLNYIQSHFTIEENDIRKIVEGSVFVPSDRQESYIKGIMAGVSGDFMTALYILVPQAENSLRELAKMCGEPVYNINEEGIEELKTIHAILNLDGIKEKLDEDFLLSLKTVFCSKFGLNIRNNIAHGLFSDEQFQSYEALYTWWFILKMCYMFCGELRIKNRIKVNKKLEKFFGKEKNI